MCIALYDEVNIGSIKSSIARLQRLAAGPVSFYELHVERAVDPLIRSGHIRPLTGLESVTQFTESDPVQPRRASPQSTQFTRPTKLVRSTQLTQST